MTRMRRNPLSFPGVFSLVLLVTTVGLTFTFSSSAEAKDCGLDAECYYDEAVKAVQGLIDDLNDTIDDLEDDIKDLEGQLEAPVQIVNNLATTIDNTTLGALGLDTDTLVRIDEAVKFINGQNAALLDDFENFESDSDDFRGKLATLLRQASRVTNLSSEILEIQRQLDSGFQTPWPVASIDATNLADHIEHVPATMLFPLYYALSKTPLENAPSFNHVTLSGETCDRNYCQFFVPLSNVIDGIDRQLVQLKTILNSMNAATFNTVSYGRNLAAANIEYPRNILCKAMFTDPAVPDQISSITSYIAVGSKILYMVADFFTKAKVTVVDGDWWAGASFGAEVQLSVQRRPGAMFGAIVKLLTGPTRMIAEGIDAKVSDCRQRLEQHLLICGIANDVKQNATFRNCKVQVMSYSENFGY